MKPQLILLSLSLAVLAINAPSVSAENLRLISSGTATVQAKEDLPNFHEVHPYLYRGGEPTNFGLAKVEKMGVKTVIDLRGSGPVTEAEKREVERLGMRYINMPMDSRAPSRDTVTTFLDEVAKAKDDKDRGAVFVHCQHGSDRTGCLVGVWRVAKEGWSYDDAYKEMRKNYFSPKFTNLSETVRRCVNKRVGE
jgi:protein tyrosine/serine phosphatase